MAEGGVEKSSLRTVLGFDDEGISTSDTFDVVVKDHGVKEGLQYDSVCIAPVVETSYDDAPEKTLQVLYTQDANMQGNLKFATVAVYEAPREVTDEATVSKIVHLRSSRPRVEASTVPKTTGGPGHAIATESGVGSDAEGIFATDPEALKYVRFGPKPGATGASSGEESEEGIFASDPEALKYIRFGPKSGTTGVSNADESEEGIFASDPETLKFIHFGPKPGAAAASNADEQEGIFASDPEALKFIRFGPKPGAAAASNADEQEGIFVSDPEALKLIRNGSNPEAAGDSTATIKESSDGIYASDSEALKCAGLPDRADEGELLAEASGVQLKDDRAYSVRVSGHQLPDGQQRKFVSVKSSDGRGGLTKEEVDNLEVSVETHVGEDGLVEKFIVVE